MQRVPFEPKAANDYIRERAVAPCFICEIVAGAARRAAHEIIYEDDQVIAFLSSLPTHYGQTLVCPKNHVEQVVQDLALADYLYLQTQLYRIARAVQQVVQPERLYIASFGSQQMNRHVHFHIHPLPAGVPVREQQMASMMPEMVGRLVLTQAEWQELGDQLRQALSLSGTNTSET